MYAPAPSWGGGCCHPCERHPSPLPEAVRTPRRRGPGSGGRGQGTGLPGHGRAAGGCSGAGGLLALDGDLAAAVALAILLVGGDLGRLDDQQPFRGQGGEHRDGIHLVGQPAGGQERWEGLGCCIPRGSRPSDSQHAGTSDAEAAAPAPQHSLCYYWSAWECAGDI